MQGGKSYITGHFLSAPTQNGFINTHTNYFIALLASILTQLFSTMNPYKMKPYDDDE